jgi:UDP-N-acetyl-D-galactosamine dehydrogenase
MAKIKKNIGVIGLGYVGLPLAIAFAKHNNVVGYDLSTSRIRSLKLGIDTTDEVSKSTIKKTKNILFTRNINELSDCNFYIIAVPTPIDNYNKPNLNPLLSASRLVSKVISKNDIVVYESTVYPGVTEDICIPIIEKNSKLKFNKDFYCGYSPERINPSDKVNTLSSIKKLVSGSETKSLKVIKELYSSIINAGVYVTPSIKVAEAAKVIENIQRDLNISLINELSIIFNKMDIDTKEVIDAAATKWNFIKYSPGLVGGHCIGVDPYYLIHKAKLLGINSKVISAGRKINNSMPKHIATQLFNKLIEKKINIKSSKILIMGFTFKENCKDTRHTQVLKLSNILKKKCSKIDIFDPNAIKKEVFKDYGLKLRNVIPKDFYDAIIVAVAHDIFIKLGYKKIRSYGKKQSVIYDLKHIFPKNKIDLRL